MPEQMRPIVRQIVDKIKIARSRALKNATWQMIAYSTLQDMTSNQPSGVEKRSVDATLEPCPWLGSKVKDHLGKPFVEGDETALPSLRCKKLWECGC